MQDRRIKALNSYLNRHKKQVLNGKDDDILDAWLDTQDADMRKACQQCRNLLLNRITSFRMDLVRGDPFTQK